MTHALKTWPEFFKEVQEGNKPFEVRKNDRGFKVGDTVILQEYIPAEKKYTGKEIVKSIAYILDNQKVGLRRGYVAFSLRDTAN